MGGRHVEWCVALLAIFVVRDNAQSKLFIN